MPSFRDAQLAAGGALAAELVVFRVLSTSTRLENEARVGE